MDNLEKLATLGTQDTGQDRKNKNPTQKKKDIFLLLKCLYQAIKISGYVYIFLYVC